MFWASSLVVQRDGGDVVDAGPEEGGAVRRVADHDFVAEGGQLFLQGRNPGPECAKNARRVSTPGARNAPTLPPRMTSTRADGAAGILAEIRSSFRLGSARPTATGRDVSPSGCPDRRAAGNARLPDLPTTLKTGRLPELELARRVTPRAGVSWTRIRRYQILESTTSCRLPRARTHPGRRRCSPRARLEGNAG